VTIDAIHLLEARYEGSDHALSAACAAVAEGLAFDATALPVTSIRFVAMADGVLLEVVIEVPDRNAVDRIEPLTVGRALICPWCVLETNGPEYLVGWLRETITNLLAHEVAESLAYRGHRVFDPHRVRAP